MKKMSLGFLLLAASSGVALANGSHVPKGYWSCTFWGSENINVPGPNGTSHYEIRPRAYAGDWFPNKDDAYADAQDSCQRFSTGGCRFSGCHQKNR